jgi:hypothetical protein
MIGHILKEISSFLQHPLPKEREQRKVMKIN